MPTRRSRRLAALLVALAVAAAVIAAGRVVSDRQDLRWTATAAVIVLPRTNVTERALAGYYESLSRGLIPATYSEILSSSDFRSALAADDRSSDQYVGAEVVPGTAVIALEARGDRRAEAEALAADVADAAVVHVARLEEPFIVAEVASGAATGERRGVPPSTVLLASVLAAVLLGAAAATGVARWPTRPASVATAPREEALQPPAEGSSATAGPAASVDATPAPPDPHPFWP